MGPDLITDILIDDATWQSGSSSRRQEWRLAIDEVLLEGRFQPTEGVENERPLRALVTVEPTQVRFEVHSGRGAHLLTHELPFDAIRPLMTEYMEVCIEMGKLAVGDNSPRLEALDIAKRITHDEAGEVVARLFHRLGPDHATARRIFTLIVTLLYDTTRLALAHPPPPRL
jgi:uncharacterized protein (UPF0262 family)